MNFFNRKTSLSLIMIMLFNSIYSQVYLLNEDFSISNGTTPPVGWNNLIVTGAATDLWKFNNPANRVSAYPIVGKFAIFDSENYSGSGGKEKISLETPFVDCSFSSSILLYFDHRFAGGRSGKGSIEIYNGSIWTTFKTYTDSMSSVVSETLDVSSLIGSVRDAKVRFTWEGDSSYYWMVDNVKILAPLSRDARLKAIDNPLMPFSAGVNPIKVTLSNEGYQTLTSATIQWTVNGVAQTPYSWSGSLALDQEMNDIQIGSFNFPSGSLRNLKIWVEKPNGGGDLNNLNDTVESKLYSALCGTYTIGGASPDFATFADAALALNNAGITCPVVFKVRDGVYNEQVKLYEIRGASAINTITFEGQSGDSSKAELHYQLSNPSNDFTLSLIKTGFITFKKLGIRRTSGDASIFVQNGVHDIVIESCRIGNFLAPNIGVDSSLIIRGNNMQGYRIDLRHQPEYKSKRILIERNYLDNLYLDNCNDVTIKSNRNSTDIASYANEFSITSSKNINFISNRFIRFYGYDDSSLNIISNIGGPSYSDWSILLNQGQNVNVANNVINARRYGIAVVNGGAAQVRKNDVIGTPTLENDGYGIYVENIGGDVLVDSNNVRNYLRYGIYSRSSGINWQIRDNNIFNVRDWGLKLEGVAGIYTGNRIVGINGGVGIGVNSSSSLVSNNYVQAEGVGLSKGISIETGGVGSSVVFNSVNITGTDVVNGRALEVLGGTNYTIKNNIFANNGGGYAAYVNALPTTRDWDYNCYFSTGTNFGNLAGQNYNILNQWGAAIGGDANSKKLNPSFPSDTALIPYQKQLNGAGISSSNILVDIEGELRN